MPDTSPILALPYLQPAQAQKHVTHNEALRQLDILVQLRVERFDALTPPATPTEGAVYALGDAPTGAWAGQAGHLAAYSGAAWQFLVPGPGWRAWGLEEAELRLWDGAGWVLPAGQSDNLDHLGIATTADATNRLAVQSAAALFSHDGDDHRLKVNKAAAQDTASVLFQSGWTGHAEIGLAGDTDLSVKLSADGSAWTEALRLESGTGRATGAAVQDDALDDTAGKLLTVGAFGLGETGFVPTIADIDALDTPNGQYRVFDGSSSNQASLPPNLQGAQGQILCLRYDDDNPTQFIWRNTGGGGFYWRTYSGGGWNAWKEILTDDGAGDVTLAGDLAVTGGTLMLNGNATGGETVTIADDAVASFTPPKRAGFMCVNTRNGVNGLSDLSGLFYYDTGSTLNIVELTGTLGLGGANLATSTSALTGTAGSDGNLTVGVQSNEIQIENRVGNSRDIDLSFL